MLKLHYTIDNDNITCIYKITCMCRRMLVRIKKTQLLDYKLYCVLHTQYSCLFIRLVFHQRHFMIASVPSEFLLAHFGLPRNECAILIIPL